MTYSRVMKWLMRLLFLLLAGVVLMLFLALAALMLLLSCLRWLSPAENRILW